MGISRPTAYKWWRRWREGGVANLVDRSSRPHSCPHQTPPGLEHQIGELRSATKLGPVRLGARLGVPASTVHRVLVRLGLNRIAWMDRPTGRAIRRIHTSRPGELIHVDVKKLGRIPPGGGWRVRGRSGETHSKRHQVGYAYLHSAIDAYSRLVFTEVHDDEQAATCAGFWRRAQVFFNDHGITVNAVLTDNAFAYRYRQFNDALGGIEHRFIRPHTPRTNGKIERFHRTLLDEWAYVRPYASETDRLAALDDWLHTYNHHRHHTAIGGPPISRINNLPDHYT
jgi:transposase InsO family protein